MPKLTKRVRHLVQLLAEELDKTNSVWNVLLSGNGSSGSKVWDFRVELGELDDEDHYESNSSNNKADIIPINIVRN